MNRAVICTCVYTSPIVLALSRPNYPIKVDKSVQLSPLFGSAIAINRLKMSVVFNNNAASLSLLCLYLHDKSSNEFHEVTVSYHCHQKWNLATRNGAFLSYLGWICSIFIFLAFHRFRNYLCRLLRKIVFPLYRIFPKKHNVASLSLFTCRRIRPVALFSSTIPDHYREDFMPRLWSRTIFASSVFQL